MSIEAFTLNGATTLLSATTGVPTPSTFVPAQGRIRVYNDAAVKAFLKSGIGASDAIATTSMTVIGPGATETFSVPTNHTHVSAITATGTASVYVQVGDGI